MLEALIELSFGILTTKGQVGDDADEKRRCQLHLLSYLIKQNQPRDVVMTDV